MKAGGSEGQADTRTDFPSHRCSRRFRKVLVGVLSLVAVLLLLIPQIWVWNPPIDNVVDKRSDVVGESIVFADAIMVLAYRDDRQIAGRDLAAAGVSDNLVVSNPEKVRQILSEQRSGSAEADVWFEECDFTYDNYRAWCVTPIPSDTRGEAVAFGELAKQQGWDSVVVVTEPTHLWRAKRIFERCFSGDAYFWASDPDENPFRPLYRSVYEAAAIYRDVLFPGAC